MSAKTPNEVFIHRSPIVNFYNGKSVFVTGATGFLGTVLVEKLLFSCDGINNIYVLIKRKHQKTIQQRLSEYLNSVAFQRVKSKNPDLMKKIIPICGNLEEERLGINTNDIKILKEEVSVVFHVAAKVIFNMHISAAVSVNTRPAEQLIAICKQMRKIDVFVYVSTAYSNVNRQVIGEKVYKTGVSLETIYDVLGANNTKGITEYLLDGRPNTYTYSKAVTEELIERNFNEIPAAIIRPSIIGSSLKEPFPGWISTWQGLQCVIAAACKGILLIWNGNPSVVFDVIPVDQVANLLIAAAWETSENRLINGYGAKVFNCCSGLRNPIDLDTFMNTFIKYRKYFGCGLSPNGGFKSKTNYVSFKIWYFIYHSIPAFILDTLCWLIGKKPKMMKTLKKLKRLSSVLEYFTQHQYLFLDCNVRALLGKMEETDRQMFDFDVTNIQWDDYLHDYTLGLTKVNDGTNDI